MEENKDEKKNNLETTSPEETPTTPEEAKTEETSNVSEPIKEEVKKETKKAKKQKTPKEKNEEKNQKEFKEEKDKKEPKKKKKVGLIVSIVVIILAIIIGAISAVIYCLFFAATKIDLAQYISIDFEGYEGYTSVDESDIIIDEKALKKAIDDSKISKKLISKLEKNMEVEDGDDLKNGDEVTINFGLKESFLKENKLKLESDSITLKVEGLEETQAIDLFEDLEFNVSGISPSLRLSLTNNSTDSFVKTVTYTMEFEDNSSSYSLSGLSNGDTVTIKASYKDSDLIKSGYTVIEDTYEYTIENQAEYVTNANAISDEVLSSLKEKFLEKVKSTSSNSYNAYSAVKNIDSNVSYSTSSFTASEPSFVKAYVLTATSSTSSTKNKIYAIYKVTFTSETGATYDYYYTVYTSNIVVSENKLYTGNTYSYYIASSYSSSSYGKSPEDAYNELIDNQKSSFDIKEIQ